MCKGSKARQHGQLEEASHGKFLHILQVSTQTCPFSLWSCFQLFQGDLHPLLFPEDLQCLFLADSLHYIVIYLDCNILCLSFLLKTIHSLKAGNYAWFCFVTATSKQWYYPFISPNERGFFPTHHWEKTGVLSLLLRDPRFQFTTYWLSVTCSVSLRPSHFPHPFAHCLVPSVPVHFLLRLEVLGEQGSGWINTLAPQCLVQCLAHRECFSLITCEGEI